MAGTDSRQIYVCIQFCGILIQALPIVFLLFVPYGIRQMRVSRRILIPVMAAGIILAGTAEAVILYDGSCQAGEDAAACWLWGNLILLCMFSIETAAYFLAVKKEAGTRLLTWLIVLHYGTFLYAVTETVEKLLEIRVYGSGFRPWSTVSIIIYVIITAITYPFIYRLMKQHRSEHMHTSNRKKLCMVTIISVLLLILYICSLSAEQKLYYFLKDGAGELCILIWMASMILMDIFAYHFYLRGLQTAEKQIEELERTSAMLAVAESQQYQSFSDRLGEDRRMYHNMRHHFRTMASLADRKQYDRLEDYLKRYLKEWEEIADRDICGNPMFNVILGYYFSLAEKKGIRVETDISIKEYYPFDITDMTVLLGNAMENAVEACEDSGADQPFIRIMLRQVKQSFLIKIENCMAPEGEEGMKKKFRKSPGAENGGTAGPVRRDRAGGDGIASMRAVAKKYDGSLEYRTEGEIFILRIVLNIPDKTAAV